MERNNIIPEDAGAFDACVCRWTDRAVAEWTLTPESLPDFLPQFSPEHQARKQRDLESLFGRVPVSKERYDTMAAGERARLRAKVRTWIARSIAPEGGEPVHAFFGECECVADAFVTRAKEFDPALPDRDVHQALRNQWVFNSIQAFCGRPVSLTPSSFAYSMLYPLTDNRLDAPDLREQERTSMLGWLSSRLGGEDTAERDHMRWAPVARLLDMIDAEFPRREFPDVHRALLAIHHAQQEGLGLNAGADKRRDAALLKLTVAKGGTSVLADGYLVSGTLNEIRGEALFGYGVLLQFIDDLQDLDEDCANGHSTPFTRVGEGAALELHTNRLMHFVRNNCGTLIGLPPAPWLPPLIEHSCMTLILEAIARYRRLYPPRYLREVGQSMPVPLEYLGDLRGRLNKRLERALAEEDAPVPV